MPNVYDDLADIYDALYDSEECHLEDKTLFDLLNSHLRGRILDVGCGTGLVLDMIDLHPDYYLGVDPSKAMVEKLHAKHPEFTAVCSTADGVHGQFDTVVALYGVGSYLDDDSIESIAKRAEDGAGIVIMGYKPGYFPKYYTAELKEQSIMRDSMQKLADRLRLPFHVFNDMVVVTNLEIPFERYQRSFNGATLSR
jgi:SAM-dependent methyltransferase